MQPITPHPDLEQLEQKLREFFSKVENVTLAYLFGSTVRGESNCLSDIDIAVLFDVTLLQKETFDLHNDSPLLLAYNIIRERVILKSCEPLRVKFETKIMSRYLDERYHIERHAKESLRRIAESGFR